MAKGIKFLGDGEWQMVLPGGLGASYIGEDGAQHIPVMLHHAVLGSMGRFIGILLEQWRGRLPLWLAPVQVAVLPVSAAQRDAAQKLLCDLHETGLRAVLMDQDESLSRRLVMVHDRLIPVRLVIGRREVESGTVMITKHGAERSLPVRDAVAEISQGMP